MVKIVEFSLALSFSMSGRLEYVIIKIVSFSMAGMCHTHYRVFLLGPKH
jgi:hypothetical protein